MRLQKLLSKNIVVIILVAIFSIVGIIACGGDAITGSGGSGYTYTEGTTMQPDEDNAGEDITPMPTL